MLEKYIGRKVTFRIRVNKEEVNGTVKRYQENFLVVDRVNRYGQRSEILVHKDDVSYILLR